MTRSLILRPWEVRAFLDRRKDVVRRPVTFPTVGPNGGVLREVVPSLLANRGDLFDVRYELDNPRAIRCPFAPGDRIVGKETWTPAWAGPMKGTGIVYRADHHPSELLPPGVRWRSPATMPAWASRIALEVVSVRVERLHDVTDADAIREGAKCEKIQNAREPSHGPLVDWLANQWDADHGRGAWARGGWCWRWEVRRVET